MMENGLTLLQEFFPPFFQLFADVFEAGDLFDGMGLNFTGVMIVHLIFG